MQQVRYGYVAIFDGFLRKNQPKRNIRLVFSDLSTPKGDGKFNAYDDLKTKLIAKGVPAEEIAFIHEANTETKKKELFAKVRKGQVRVLIGSTQKMGAGTNVQDKLIALHDMDCPWRPADLAQRLGRIVRQGNSDTGGRFCCVAAQHNRTVPLCLNPQT